MDRMLIGGEWVGALGGGCWALQDTGNEEHLADLPFGDARDAEAAIEAAAAAAPAWAKKTAYERGALLERAAQLITERVERCAVRTSEESGKPLAQSRGEWLGAPNYLRFAAEESRRLGGRWVPARQPGRRIDVTYAPLGVIGVITAWNFPIYNVNRASASALAAGNTVVLRPSEYTPRTAMDYAEALTDAGLPPGVFNVINGEPAAMGQAMLNDARVRKIAFTGSTRVGRLLMEGAARTVTRLSLELGGNAPVLVFPGVDIQKVARGGLTAKLRNAGQVCIAPQRFYVHESIYADFLAALVQAAGREVSGHALDPRSTLGPLINRGQRERVHALVEATRHEGALVSYGGEVPSGKGWFYPPTVLADPPAESAAMVEELFGPVLTVSPFEHTDGALAAANHCEHGLAAYVWTPDLRTAMTVSESLEYGMVGVNDWYPVTAEAPFGGVKQSGLGRESGAEGVAEYVEAKTRYFGGL